jgi:predicted N-formylglutamate amidohydrolase
MGGEPATAVEVKNRLGAGRFVIICDHASNRIPPAFGNLGLDEKALGSHIAWDPGALAVADRLAARLDAPLVYSTISRLIADCNRAPEAADIMPAVSETTAVPGNTGLSGAERAARLVLAHTPFHDALAALINERLAAGRETWLVSVHSFTPTYKGVFRPWQVGVIHDDDQRLARPLIAALKRLEGVTVGDNQPYSPSDGVYYTLERHARRRGLPCVMIEIRNNEIADAAGQTEWAERLAAVFEMVNLAEKTEAGA